MKFWIFLAAFFCLYMSTTPEEAKYLEARERMVQEQIMQRGITNPRVLDAFRKVKRHLFVKPAIRDQAYDDSPLDIGEGQIVNRPYIIAMMTYVIAPTNHKKVLEIGTGSGYHAAILAELAEQVFTIEIEEKLAQKAKRKLLGLGYQNIRFKVGDGALGWKEHAPFDSIICTYSPDHIPPLLLEQLAVGGRMIIEVSHSSKVQEFILIEKDNKGDLKRTNLIPVQFTPVIRGENGK